MRPVIVGIAGGSGSGKSTVARRVTEMLGDVSTAFIAMDAYYRNMSRLSAEQLRQVNWDHPNAFDLELFVSHLEALAAGSPVDMPAYDFATHTRSPHAQRVQATDVLVLEGILLFVDRRVRDLCDLKLFVDADPDIRLVRRIRRDMHARARPLDEILEQYLSTVRPMHLKFVEPSKRFADMVLLHGAHNEAAIQMIVAEIHRRLATRAS